MDVISCFINIANELFRPILLIIASFLTIYFASKKIGDDISARYSFGAKNFEPVHIREVVLSNKKDKPVVIYSVFAVFNNELWLELRKCNPPIIVKPFEAVSLLMSPYSYLSVNSDRFEPKFTEAEIYIEGAEKLIKCNSQYRPKLLGEKKMVSVSKFEFNDCVYDESVAYILAYVIDKKTHTAFIHQGGYIGNEWGFSPNFIPGGATESKISAMITSNALDKVFDSYQLYEVVSLGNIRPVGIIANEKS